MTKKICKCGCATGQIKKMKNPTIKLKDKKVWIRHYRSDRGIWEDICPHGVGHCEDVHGCDGCCDGLYENVGKLKGKK